MLTAATMTVLAVSLAKVASQPAAPDPVESAPVAPAGHSVRPEGSGRAHRDGPSVGTTKAGVLGRIDLYQQQRRPLAFIVGVVKKFSDDRAGRLAALIAYYGFFSIFPAMLALVTVLGFVLEGDSDLRSRISDSAVAQFPVIGDRISAQVNQPLTGNTIALIVGIVGAVWAGMGAMQAAQDAMNEVWDVPRTRYPNFAAKRLRSIAMLLLIVVGLAASSTISQLAVNVVGGLVATVALFIANAACNILMYLVAFRVLTVAELTWRQVLPGAVAAGIGYTALQVIGTLYITHTLRGAQETYGTFAVVIGLLSWIYLIAQLTMFAAEANVVAARREWPRSLFTPAATSADERTVAAQATENTMDPEESVTVSFDDARVRR